ncbi:hypothetical protein A2291_03410 [candidate division WOR-1 bacterium RIFOXYB2_FULL_42_35]|uniref:Type II secretion system protein GspF domain-containing protein n=1 Tax=candidate division WOR-1 bacterium RIFOXYC2_FULL_41_25 TaxID=1802586 RepID=A0A1F4TS98_UNCSA|nr:MAG: hypothetical protein A2247_02980 [candidate division WOR-1 bacterium RIFOXYA2_FULL_41_14]OGC25511.1 MAG: hypothetical protein A2291_03410 [candidate division WOR-1 bacterium RIFOXYB2_FULL_42_35]OGC34943.1 MAG: hypothetical protein A2462_05040 [candidate division WOR-1 bacterium RIFOXYC2_FULL_41_25]OGC42014.1 MAG: hypothetical protein A2548_00420 [candidate division WOR-1 bacterium RIFOXYD2_FULL_41_8]
MNLPVRLIKIGSFLKSQIATSTILSRRGSGQQLSKNQTARFCGQLQMLLVAGVPIFEALTIINNLFPNKGFEKVIQKISDGETLGIALKEILPSMVTSSIETAEQAGNLEAVLGRLQTYYENRAETEDKVKSALVYPVFVVGLCLLCIGVMFVVVLPGFKGLFADLNTELPLFSKIIMGMGDVFAAFWYVPIMLGFVSSTALVRYRKTEHGGLNFDSWLLKNKFYSRGQIIQTFRTLGAMLEGGIPIRQSLQSTSESTGNKAFQTIMFQIKSRIEDGERLSDILRAYNLFPNEAIQMLAVGENSGQLGQMLINIAQFYEKEREVAIKRFTSLLEPILTLIVGLVVGLVAVAMFLPMMSILSQIE